MGLSQPCITVMGPGIIESVQIVIWANEWIVPRDLRGFSHLENGDVWEFISLFSTVWGGGVL